MIWDRWLRRIGRIKHIAMAIALWGVLLSLLFSFLIYPKIAGPFSANLDPDGYGAIGRGLWTHSVLSYVEDGQPTVFRGPVYPFFLAMTLKLTWGWWPGCAQLAQCILLGATCLLVFWISRTMWDRRVAVLATIACAMHPMLVWYTSRIWIETLLAFLFTLLMAAILYLSRQPSTGRAVLAGIALGVCTLAKSIFLPFVVILPLLLRGWRILDGKQAVCLPFVALAIVSPWTVRNYTLTGRIIPVHIGAGAPMSEGDTRMLHFSESPWAFGPLYEIHRVKLEQLVASDAIADASKPRWEREMLIDQALLQESLGRYREDPAFLVKKLAANIWMFFVWSQTKTKTFVLLALQVPVLLLFIVAAIRAIGRSGQRRIATVQLAVLAVYVGLHLPLQAHARFSAALLPIILVYACSVLVPITGGTAGYEKDEAFHE